jgi:poly-gamma-glutamate synthesis protein (capsule biosynthesis protein)
LIAVVLISAAGFGVYRLIDSGILFGVSPSPSAEAEDSAPVVEEDPPEPDIDIDIACVGDILIHSPQISAADRGDGNYDFSEYFPHVKPYIESADMSICNLEFTFGGEPYKGYPLFSAPDSLAQTLKDTGFDVGTTANNHMLDSGADGITRTIDVASGAGLLVTGSVTDPAAKDYLITEVKGIKVGIVAYTYETSLYNGGRTINGIPMSEETRARVNSFSWESLDADMQAVKQSMDGARADGAEILICVFHWGNEYERQPNEYQQRMAQMVIDFGADIIFASHPHVLQPFEVVTSSQTGRQVPVFWSMGNFISNQRADNLNHPMRKYTEQGMIAQVRLIYNPNYQMITKLDMKYIPTWVDKYNNGTRNVFTVVPLVSGYESNPDLTASGHIEKASQALADIHELLGAEDGLSYEVLDFNVPDSTR